MVPLIIVPVGGILPDGSQPVTVQRIFATARSVEFDALLLARVPDTGSDAFGARDAGESHLADGRCRELERSFRLNDRATPDLPGRVSLSSYSRPR